MATQQREDLHLLRNGLSLLGRRQANLCFHFAGSGENLPDITKSLDASLDNKELYSFT